MIRDSSARRYSAAPVQRSVMFDARKRTLGARVRSERVLPIELSYLRGSVHVMIWIVLAVTRPIFLRSPQWQCSRREGSSRTDCLSLGAREPGEERPVA
jgi:hypothetical protein